MLEIKNLTKVFNPDTINEKLALDDVSLCLNPGDFVTLIGGNGAGKSTLLNCVAGVYRQEGGSITLDGQRLDRLSEHKRAKHLGRVFQDPLMGTAADMEIQENLALALRRGMRRTLRWGVTSEDKALFHERLAPGLGLEDRMSVKVRLFSGGQRQAYPFNGYPQRPSALLDDCRGAGPQDRARCWSCPSASSVKWPHLHDGHPQHARRH